MTDIPKDLKYTQDHEWIRMAGNGTAQVGITAFAQESLGDITFIELPKPGSSFKVGEVFGVAESVKAASELYMPVSAEVVEINTALDSAPDKVNSDPYAEGWMLKVKLLPTADTSKLLSPEAYQALL